MTAVLEITQADPSTVTDCHGRQWRYDPRLHSFWHDDGRALMLRSKLQIRAQFGPITEDSPGTLQVPEVVHDRGEVTEVMPAVMDEQQRRAS